jgi:hypothetical protein
MKQIVIIGALDKTDMMLYLCKLVATNHKVLLVDATGCERYKYAYPKMELDSVIHQHDQFDIAECVTTVETYQRLIAEGNYDYVLIDLEDAELAVHWSEADQFFMVTSYDNPVMQRNLQLMEALSSNLDATVLIPVARVICEVAGTLREDYLDDLFSPLHIEWKDTFVYYPDERDLAARIHNQMRSNVNIKRISGDYRKVLSEMAESILEIGPAEAKKLWKRAERSR